MKYLILMLFMAIGLASTAQTLTIQESWMEQNGELVPTIQVILEPEVDDFQEKFENYLNNNRDVDLGYDRLLAFGNKIMLAKGVVIRSVSDQKVDLKVFHDDTELGKTQFNMFSSFGYTNWITPKRYPFEYAAMNAFLLEFVKTQLPEYHQK